MTESCVQDEKKTVSCTGSHPENGRNISPTVPGSMVANFRIVREIGRGGMGVVYCACQENLKREIALKVLADKLAGKQRFVESFFNEARAAANLSHPNIVQAYDAGITKDGLCYFAMELIRGESLDRKLAQNGALPLLNTLASARDIADALAYAWNSREMCHGDVKPDNILVTENGVCKLADFGLAKSMHETRREQQEMMVTPLYASPEIVSGRVTSVNMKSDMYSFGATFYHLLAGSPVFADDDIRKIYLKHVNEIPQKLCERNPRIPAECSDFFDCLLEKDPEKRPASWEDIAGGLQDLIDLFESRETVWRRRIFNWKSGMIFAACFFLSILVCTMFSRPVKRRQRKVSRREIAIRKASLSPKKKRIPSPPSSSQSPPAAVHQQSLPESSPPSPVVTKKVQETKEERFKRAWEQEKAQTLALPPLKRMTAIRFLLKRYHVSEHAAPEEFRRILADADHELQRIRTEKKLMRTFHNLYVAFRTDPPKISIEKAEKNYRLLAEDPVFPVILAGMSKEEKNFFRELPEKIRRENERLRIGVKLQSLQKEFDFIVKKNRYSPAKLEAALHGFLKNCNADLPPDSTLFREVMLVYDACRELDEKKCIQRHQDLLRGKNMDFLLRGTLFERAEDRIVLRFAKSRSTLTKISYTQKNRKYLLDLLRANRHRNMKLDEYFLLREIWDRPGIARETAQGKKDLLDLAEVLLRNSPPRGNSRH